MGITLANGGCNRKLVEVPRKVVRLIGALLLLGLGLARAQTHVVEFRRTFSAPDCSTGEVYIDGRLSAFFYASRSLMDEKLESEPVIGDSVVSEVFNDVAPYLPKKALGANIMSAGSKSLRILALDGTSYWQYARPRKKARTLPSDVILIGTKLLNRECTIKSTAEDDYFESDYYYSWPSNILGRLVFDGRISKDNFIASVSSESIFLVSDSSESRRYDMGGISASVTAPREAVAVASEDPCLLKIEHMANTVVSNGSTSYQRRDDVWFCTNGDLQGATGKTFVEWHQDLRYWELVSDEVCATVLGLPLNRRYLVYRDDLGSATSAWTRCLATDEWVKVAEKALVTVN